MSPVQGKLMRQLQLDEKAEGDKASRTFRLLEPRKKRQTRMPFHV